ncbi:MAG: prepilin-type N-terminal cleavage/methylation domain-containing protein [Verrucomicrobiota bacterium]|jgi:prepilin-type N-terminal cleavage/methylation domain-containing protein
MRLGISSSRAPFHRRRAFTFIEVMVAVLVIGSVFTGFYLCLSQGFATTEASRENLRATQILEQQMETIRLYTWSQINSNGFIPASFTAPFNPVGTQPTNGLVYTAHIAIANAPMAESYASNHVLVTVTLNWTNGNNQPHQRQMSTIVSQYGLHNYYY